MLTLALATLAIWLWLILGHGRFWQAGPILAPAAIDALAAWPLVAVVIPARDEAAQIAACLHSMLAQDYPGRCHIVLVDDRSTDGTFAIATAIAVQDPRLRVVSGIERPSGWSGKLWAVQQGVAAADPDAALVLLCDADIVHDPRHLTTLVAKAERDRLDLVSEMVALNCDSPAERALVPAFVFFFQLLYPFARVNRPASKTAAAAGGTILIRSAALARIGGIAALRGALIDDVALATLVKRNGGAIWLGHSALARSVRPYPGAADIWRMVARTAYVQLRFSPLLLAGTVLGMLLVWIAPLLTLLAGHGVAAWIGGGAWLLSTASFLPTLRRFGQNPLWALLLPAIGLFYTAATLGSALDHHRGRGVVWKNRAYTDSNQDQGAA